ncbi:Adaptin N terminal region family protein [Histomonas meleagridis]|uniref:Adaptin N terminal region family protein n=1 Tax=Histomonas meleagridis TaxID=135588 RepID=UPI003559BB7C|nr:Adaptin N terminal region family protein [Histomonas meleagridis]KAH0806635.1 Adaptin N terminal region family protein [Histomonas meleagridis]
MSQSAVDFITSVRFAESLEDERFIIKCELADIRTLIRNCDPDLKPRLIAKLVFLDIIGENVSFGQMEVVNLMSHPRLSYKRIGYMAASVLLNETSETTVLLTHTLLKDLQSNNPQFQTLALSLLANIGSQEMCQTLVTEVQKLIDNSSVQIMKHAAMAAVRIVDKLPDIADSFIPSVYKLLKSGAHSVFISATCLIEAIIRQQPQLITSFHKYHKSFIKILAQLNRTRSREFQYSIFNDPFLQIRLLRILTLLKKPSTDLDDVLKTIFTCADTQRNCGRSVMSAVVDAIMSTSNTSSLRGLAFAQVGRLLKSKEPNVVYYALTIFSKTLYNENNEIIGRTNGDTIALQRYRSFVIQCLNHRDPSIRRRSLNVISALIDETNITTLIPEILNYIKLSDSEFRIELIAKIFTAIQRFSDDIKWKFDIIYRIIVENDNYLGNDLITSFCNMVLNNPQIQLYSIEQFEKSLVNYSNNQTMTQIASWYIGEFSSNIKSYEILKQILLMPQTNNQTKGYILISISKLSIRFKLKEDAIKVLEKFKNNENLDLQQRSEELIKILSNNEINEEILSPIEMTTNITNNNNNNKQIEIIQNETSNKKEEEIVDDLLSIVDIPNNNNSFNDKKNYLNDLINDVTKPLNEVNIKPFPGSIEAMRKKDFVMYFEIAKNPQNLNQIAIRASFFNTGSQRLNNFNAKYGVPIGWSLKAQQQSGSVLDTNGQPIVQQMMLVGNGSVKLAMRAVVSYEYGSQPVTESGDVNPIFD